ncbi:MAG: hypothetical protein JWO60_578 [Frankiales bacterium]|nr:hypothetical protein [Frankiales bacterium]
MRTLPALALLLALTACGGASEEASPDTSAAAPSSATTAPSTPPTTAPTTEAGATLVLRKDGLALRSGSSTVAIPFGSGTSLVAPALASALGEPEQKTVPCGQGPRTSLSSQGFDVLFDGERFVGWDESGAGLVTDDGLRIGSTRAEVVKALPDAEFSQTELGTEFASPGGLSGFLDGPSETASVVGLVGGEVCEG